MRTSRHPQGILQYRKRIPACLFVSLQLQQCVKKAASSVEARAEFPRLVIVYGFDDFLFCIHDERPVRDHRFR
jgi:hypothetical protein